MAQSNVRHIKPFNQVGEMRQWVKCNVGLEHFTEQIAVVVLLRLLTLFMQGH
jgi:hypothetical protein